LQRHIQSRRGVIDRATDQRLHRGIAAAGINELHVEAVVLEMTVGARDFVRHPTQELAAVSERDLPALRLCRAGRSCGNYTCGEACTKTCALEQRAPGKIGARHTRGRFVAAAHNTLIGKLAGNLIGSRIVAMLQV
jgi:hypothetical protein